MSMFWRESQTRDMILMDESVVVRAMETTDLEIHLWAFNSETFGKT